MYSTAERAEVLTRLKGPIIRLKTMCRPLGVQLGACTPAQGFVQLTGTTRAPRPLLPTILEHAAATGQVPLEQDPGAVRRDGRVDIELLRARMGQDAQAAAVGAGRDNPGRRELVIQTLRPHDPARVRSAG